MCSQPTILASYIMRGLRAAIVLALLAAHLQAEERLELRVLYCGEPASERLADFRSFLERYFDKVSVVDLREFKEEQAKDQDVVIFDWTNVYGKGGIDQKKWAFQAPRLSKDFTRPAILIGRAGGKVSMALDLKIDWLCLCLDGPAHKVAVDHPIFRAPLDVKPQLEEMPVGEEDPYETIDGALGQTHKVWKVQTKNYPDVDPGLVSTLYGFTDSPDAEVIAQGLARKGPDTVALGRHANYFLWGFSAPPADMTPAARRLFVNVVSYMHKFDGQKPLVRKKWMAREWALRFAAIPRLLSDDYKQLKSRSLRASFAKHPQWIDEKYKGDVERGIADTMEKLEKAEIAEMEEVLPYGLREEFGMDADKYLAFYRQNLEYLRPVEASSMSFEVDDDVKSLGLSNRRVELLDRCVSMLEQKDRPDLALRVLKRYTEVDLASAGQWRAWLQKHRAQLFFSDVGGYKFFVGPAAQSAEASN